MKKYLKIPTLFLIAFVVFEIILLNTLSLSSSTQYLIEALLISGWYFFQKQWPRWHWKLSLNIYIDFFMLFLSGFLIYQLSIILQIPSPLQNPTLKIYCLLVLFAPIWEELLYRGALWEMLSQHFSPKLTRWLNCLLFSLGHLSAILFVPEEYRAFIVYQALYTFMLAYWLTYKRNKLPALNFVYLDHLGFNLGFAVGLAALL